MACLRIADHLDRTRAGRVTDLAVEIRDRELRLEVMADQDPSTELWKLEQHGPLFKRAFGRRLELAVPAQPTTAAG